MSGSNTLLESCDSTNDLAKKLGENGSPHGTWISARTQTGGRGRLGRKWVSGDGNLFFSMIARPPRDFPISTTPLCAALALFDSIQKIKKIPELKIKWPNDLVVVSENEKGIRSIQKVGGILCEGVGSVQGSFVVIGIGANCKTAPEVEQATASLHIPVDELRNELISSLSKIYDQPWSAQKTRYLQSALLKAGDLIEWTSLKDPSLIEHAHVEDYGEFGELCVIDSENQLRRLYSEEVKIKARG